MTTFTNGIAHGVTLSLQRAPLFLRVVINPAGKIDALDLLDDEPEACERIEVYICRQFRGIIHVSRRPRSESGWYASADYQYLPEQPSEEITRDTDAWQTWCLRKRDEIDGVIRLGEPSNTLNG
jgi:hypothetical protein